MDENGRQFHLVVVVQLLLVEHRLEASLVFDGEVKDD